MTSHENMTAWVRVLRCKAIGGNDGTAVEIARSSYGPSSLPARILEKSAAIWSGDIANDPDLRAASRGFIELVRSRSLVGKITGFQRVPFETAVLREVTPLDASWTAEGAAIPVTHSTFEASKLDMRKMGAILPVTDTVLKGAGAAFESTLSRQLVGAVATLENVSLTDPANAGATGVSPASLTNGVTPTSGSNDAAADVNKLADGFGGDLETAVLITSPRAGLALHNAGFESTGVRGGDVGGLVHVTSSDIPDSRVILLDPTGIILADDGVLLDVSDQTTLQLTDSNGDPTTDTISLWQLNLAAIRVVRHMNWLDLRGGSVAYVNDAAWVTP